MKLVKAKCPNCGANLDINPDSEVVKCKYCRNNIIVEDAVEKYKLEVTGEVELSEDKKIKNLLNLANRNYINKDYDEAYKNYKSILELDSNNPIAIFRHGVCKTKLNNYIDFKLDYLIQSLKDSINILKDKNELENEIDNYIKDSIITIDEAYNSTKNFYNKYTPTESDIEYIQEKLISIFNAYELILEYSKDKENLYHKIVSVLKEFLREKKYKTGQTSYGGDIIKTIHPEKSNIKYVNKLVYYQKLIHEDVTEYSVTNEKNQKSYYLIAIQVFLVILILGSFMAKQFLSSLVIILIFAIISFNKVSAFLFKNDSKKKKILIIILVILLFITIALGY